MFPGYSNGGTLILNINPGMGTGRENVAAIFDGGSSLGRTGQVDHCCSSPNKRTLLILLIFVLKDWIPLYLGRYL